MKCRFIPSLTHITAEHWDQLWPGDYPFTRYAFLLALESSGCTSADSGWQPHHLLLEDEHGLAAILPLYRKTHSYGEYVFDWGWADAWHRSGIHYYPKLLTAIPFTPATGPRLGCRADLSAEILYPRVVDEIQQEALRLGASGWHGLFATRAVSDSLHKAGASQRWGCQFHWFNREYGNFDDFLATFNARKRKSLKRERRQVIEQDVTLQRYCGKDIPADAWLAFYHFYHATYLKRSGNSGYLNRAFFQQLAASCDQVMMVVAHQQQRIVATALYFYDRETLYGRYWGTLDEIPGLHFEACYYQGIEFAIEQGLKRFDPGAQGEHKIQRGFVPVITYSNHWVAHTQLRLAVDDFLAREKPSILAYRDDCRASLPFSEGFPLQELIRGFSIDTES